jgi:hypothetical protein
MSDFLMSDFLRIDGYAVLVGYKIIRLSCLKSDYLKFESELNQIRHQKIRHQTSHVVFKLVCLCCFISSGKNGC